MTSLSLYLESGNQSFNYTLKNTGKQVYLAIYNGTSLLKYLMVLQRSPIVASQFSKYASGNYWSNWESKEEMT